MLMSHQQISIREMDLEISVGAVLFVKVVIMDQIKIWILFQQINSTWCNQPHDTKMSQIIIALISLSIKDHRGTKAISIFERIVPLHAANYVTFLAI